MGVKLRKHKGKWYLFIDHQGKRKAKCIGASRQLAENLKQKLEAKLALGEFGFLQDEAAGITFKEYSDAWLKQYAEIHCKDSTVSSYKQLLRLYLEPRFGATSLAKISRSEVKKFLVEMTIRPKHQRKRKSDEEPADAAIQEVKLLSRNTLRLALATLRVIFNHAIEDGIVDRNPAYKLGKFTKTDKPEREASAMTREEAQQLLNAVQQLSSEYYGLFLVALRAGLRRGELVALKWGDIQFGADEKDPNRYILVQRNYVQGRFTSPKSKKSRRVDLSLQLRQALLELRDARLVSAYADGVSSITDQLIFPSKAGTVLHPDNLVHYYFEPALTAAGLRKFRFHDLRHTFGSLLIQNGASLTYVRDQMGHSSIQVTADVYGHLVPGANVSWVDSLDAKPKPTPQKSATQAQPRPFLHRSPRRHDDGQVPDFVGDGSGERGRNRTFNLLIKR
jgi:integrase